MKKDTEDSKTNTNIENIESDDSESNKIQYYSTEKYSEINKKKSEGYTSDEDYQYNYKPDISDEESDHASYSTRKIDPTMPIINNTEENNIGAKSLPVQNNDSTFCDKYGLLDFQEISLDKSLNKRDNNQEELINKYPIIDKNKYIQNDNREINIHESNKSNESNESKEKSILYPRLDSYDIYKTSQVDNIISEERISNEPMIQETNDILTNKDLTSENNSLKHELVMKDLNALRMPDRFTITKETVTNNDYNSLGVVKQENHNLLTDQKNENKKHENSNIESIIKNSDLFNIKQNNIVSSDNNEKNRSVLKESSDNNYNGTMIGFSILLIAVVIGIVYSRSKNTHDMYSQNSIDEDSDDDL